MKITKQKLINIIKEELDAALAESKSPMPMERLTDAEWVLWQKFFNKSNKNSYDSSMHANEKIIAKRNAEILDGYFNAEDEEKRQRAEDAMSQAVKELPYDASNAELDKRALELLEPSKGALPPKPNDDGIDF